MANWQEKPTDPRSVHPPHQRPTSFSFYIFRVHVLKYGGFRNLIRASWRVFPVVCEDFARSRPTSPIKTQQVPVASRRSPKLGPHRIAKISRSHRPSIKQIGNVEWKNVLSYDFRSGNRLFDLFATPFLNDDVCDWGAGDKTTVGVDF